MAIAVDEYMAVHRRLPAETGMFLEAASTVAVAAARRLLGRGGGSRVVALGTGSGLKGLAGDALRTPVTTVPGLDALVAANERAGARR
jgi:threonine synthase